MRGDQELRADGKDASVEERVSALEDWQASFKVSEVPRSAASRS
jgi:hypothetical protein